MEKCTKEDRRRLRCWTNSSHQYFCWQTRQWHRSIQTQLPTYRQAADQYSRSREASDRNKPQQCRGPRPSTLLHTEGVLYNLSTSVSSHIHPITIETGTLPSAWKTAFVSPIFRKGATCQAENYRPVSLTCVTCKMLQHIICHHVRSHLDRHSIFSPLQHGFRSGHSYETQLLTTMYDLLSIRDSGSQTGVIVLGFS